MDLKNLFNKKPDQSIKEIISLSRNSFLSNLQLFDYEMEKFGLLTIEELIKEYGIKKIYHKNINIEPINIIAASHHPHFCNTPIIAFYLNKDKRHKFNKHFLGSDTYFFSNINSIDPYEAMKFYIINDANGNKKYIIRHGHHRSITAYFLQLLEKSYRLKGVEAIEYDIDWSRINTRNKYLTFFNKKNFFDYKNLISWFKYRINVFQFNIYFI